MTDNDEILEKAKRTILGRLIWFCLTNKLVVLLLVIATLGWGVMVAPFDWDIGELPRDPVPVDAIPDIGENQQIVFTQWMGRSPQDVEDQIGYPLTVALLGIPEVKTIRSYSMFGFSSIYIIFGEDADFYWSRTRVLEKLNSLPSRNAARRSATDARAGRDGAGTDLSLHAGRSRSRWQTDRRLGSARTADDPGLLRSLCA